MAGPRSLAHRTFAKVRGRIPKSRTIVLGDFNQRIPPKWVPRRMHEALKQAFNGFKFATEKELAGAPGLSIDHIAYTPDLTRNTIEIWSKKSAEGTRLSDHFGVWGDFGLC